MEQYLLTLRRGNELAIVDAATREEDFGWVFFYQSAKFLETRDRQWALGGNAPVIVDRERGTLEVTGTGHSVQHYIDEYRQRRLK